MFDPDAAVDDALREAARSGRPALTHLTITMFNELLPFANAMPPVAVDALAVAARYWLTGGASDEELTAARVACWRYLEAKNRNSVTVVGRHDYLTRAVLCVLYPPVNEVEDDVYETAGRFDDFLIGAVAADRE